MFLICFNFFENGSIFVKDHSRKVEGSGSIKDSKNYHAQQGDK